MSESKPEDQKSNLPHDLNYFLDTGIFLVSVPPQNLTKPVIVNFQDSIRIFHI